MPSELIHLRGARSKTFLLDDGVTHRLEVGGGHAHHKKDGVFVPTDSAWAEDATDFKSGKHPWGIGFKKATRTLTLTAPDGTVLTLTPLNMRTPTSITKVGNTVTLVRLWTGITLTLILSPKGVHFHYTKTSTTFVNPSFTVTGPWATYYGPNYYTVGDVTTTMPQTLVGGVLTYDFAAVPVGVGVG
jgi:hypothetical protein